jgi:hypothetical protein
MNELYYNKRRITVQIRKWYNMALLAKLAIVGSINPSLSQI